MRVLLNAPSYRAVRNALDHDGALRASARCAGQRNFNAAVDRYTSQLEHLGRRVYLQPKWLRYQVRRSRESYVPAMRAEGDRKPWPQIAAELAELTLRWRCLPFHYLRYGLFRTAVDERAIAEFLPETIMYYVILPRINRRAMLLDDKLVFKDLLDAWGVPAPQTVLTVRDGQIFAGHESIVERSGLGGALATVRAERLMLKPASFGSGGSGIETFARTADGYRSAHGEDLASRVWALATAGRSWLVEEYIEQCPETAALHPSSVNSLRLMTWRHPHSGPRVIYTMLKCGVGGRPTDNAHTDGLYVRVREDGSLDPTAWDEQLRPHVAHPDTGFVFASGMVPHIAAVRALALRCATIFPSLAFAGWDIAVTPGGRPLVIEGNSSPGLTIIQRTHGGMAPSILSCLRTP